MDQLLNKDMILRYKWKISDTNKDYKEYIKKIIIDYKFEINYTNWLYLI